ncbi:MAG: superoxide dismutase family protein [Flavobacteriaceae bacterium]|jgi:Cu-Zn family superoxide dismutase|nr:superoxide dismutase family protein [Flavobacteriaceae bacterium]
MKKSFILLIVLGFAFTTSCKNEKKNTEPEAVTETQEKTTNSDATNSSTSEDSDKVIVMMEPKSGSTAQGNVVFRQRANTVSMTAVFSGLEEGEHAVHLHEKSDCSAEDGTSSGGHWNPTGQPHGKWGDQAGYHKGDIGNFTVNANGTGTITFVTDEWCIGCGDETKDILGKAIIVHQGIDDFTSQPSGAAGARISCGGVIQ